MHSLLLNVHSSSIGNAQREGASSRDRRPSDKVAAQRKFFPNALKATRKCYASTGEAEREMAKLKAEKEERRAIRKKKAAQKANQQAGIGTDSEDKFEPRANPLVSQFILMWINC